MEAERTVERERTTDAARQAGWELDAMLALLLERVGPGRTAGTPEEHELWMQVRGVSMRARALCDVLMSANDGMNDANSMEQAIYGRPLADQQHAEAAHG